MTNKHLRLEKILKVFTDQKLCKAALIKTQHNR